MKKRELNISDKTLHLNTKEDIIFKSPLRIPPRELQELSNLKSVNLNHYAFYDIAETENQAIRFRENEINLQIFNSSFENILEREMEMGNINDT